MVEELPALLPLLYEYPYDFTNYADVLAAQVVGAQPTEALAEVMNKVMGDPWTTTPKKEYTLYKATVSYVGENKTGHPTSKRYKYVVVIALSARYKSRSLYLVFNKLP